MFKCIIAANYQLFLNVQQKVKNICRIVLYAKQRYIFQGSINSKEKLMLFLFAELKKI